MLLEEDVSVYGLTFEYDVELNGVKKNIELMQNGGTVQVNNQNR